MRVKIAHAARLTGVHARTIRRWVDDGDIIAWDDEYGLTLVDPDEVKKMRATKTVARLANLRNVKRSPHDR